MHVVSKMWYNETGEIKPRGRTAETKFRIGSMEETKTALMTQSTADKLRR